MILPTIKSLCESFRPELIDVMLSYFSEAGKEVQNNLELSRMQAEVLFPLVVQRVKISARRSVQSQPPVCLRD